MCKLDVWEKMILVLVCCWVKLVTSMPYDANIGFGEPDNYGKWVPIYPVYTLARGAFPMDHDMKSHESNDEESVTATVETEIDVNAAALASVVSLPRLPPPTYMTKSKNQQPVAPVTLPAVEESEAISKISPMQWGDFSLPPAWMMSMSFLFHVFVQSFTRPYTSLWSFCRPE